jgi:hypothetical protein
MHRIIPNIDKMHSLCVCFGDSYKRDRPGFVLNTTTTIVPLPTDMSVPHYKIFFRLLSEYAERNDIFVTIFCETNLLPLLSRIVDVDVISIIPE